MALLQYQIPEDVPWGDYFCDTASEVTLEDEGEWTEVATKKQPKVQNVNKEKWCRAGNACPYIDCKFRHERCSHYDNWVKRGRKGHNCRCHATDPEGNKSVEKGGCMYDHRNFSKLTYFEEILPCKTESQLWDSFFQKGLELHVSDVYDVRRMNKRDRHNLILSLKKAEVDYVDHETYVCINYD